MPVQLSFDSTQPMTDKVLRITLMGYVPCTRNQMDSCHWMVKVQEKKRTGMALLAALKSGSLFIHGVPAITTDGTSRLCRTFSAKLASYQTTDGRLFLVGRVPKRFQRKGKKGPKLKSALVKEVLPF